MNHTAEEIRALANVFEHGPVFDMLNAYADMIKADESARGRIDFKGMWNAMSDRATTNPPAQSVDVDSWTGEIECCDAKGFWLILADDCPFVPGQKVTITAALQEKGNGA